MATPINQMSMAKAQETFFYDKSDGSLYWKIRPSKRIMWGSQAGSLKTSKGYYSVMLKGKNYMLHNLIWNFHNGEIAEGQTVDHKDKNPSNNHMSNLRLANESQQNINTRSRGFKWRSDRHKWSAQHFHNKKERHLGSFTTALQARLAYESYTSTIEPEFASTFFTDAINRLCAE